MSILRRTTVALACALAAAVAWAGTASETLDRTVPLPEGGQVVVQNLNGTVQVTAWDQPQVRVVAIKTARGTTEGRARAYLEDLQVRIDQRGNRLVVQTKTPGSEGGIKGWIACAGVDGEVNYRLEVPRDAGLAATTVNGDVQVSGLSAPVRAASTNGNVEVLEVAGEVDASSVNGNIHVGLRKIEPRSAMELATVNGNIDLTLPLDFRAYLDARTTNGSVGSDLPLEVEGHRSRSRLVGRLNGGTTRLTLRTSNGNIWLKNRP